MIFVFLMDILEEVVRIKDTSYLFMLESYKRGYDTYYLRNKGISLLEKGLSFEVKKIKPLPTKEKNPFEILETDITLNQREVDAVFVRTNPPFDQSYLNNTWLLSLLDKRIFCINSPNGLREVNEKIWLNRFDSFSPKTIITQNINYFNSFLAKQKTLIAKPLNGFGGQGVFIIKENDSNKHVIFETLTNNFSQKVVLQEFVKEASKGDKRVLLLNGKILGAVMRVNKGKDHRNNFATGGEPQACEVTQKEKLIIQTLAPKLKQLGLDFVGLDFLGEKLTEVNITSPTCLQEINRLYNKSFEKEVINFVEEKVKQCKS